jgi:hypothetical protein
MIPLLNLRLGIVHLDCTRDEDWRQHRLFDGRHAFPLPGGHLHPKEVSWLKDTERYRTHLYNVTSADLKAFSEEGQMQESFNRMPPGAPLEGDDNVYIHPLPTVRISGIRQDLSVDTWLQVGVPFAVPAGPKRRPKRRPIVLEFFCNLETQSEQVQDILQHGIAALLEPADFAQRIIQTLDNEIQTIGWTLEGIGQGYYKPEDSDFLFSLFERHVASKTALRKLLYTKLKGLLDASLDTNTGVPSPYEELARMLQRLDRLRRPRPSRTTAGDRP